MACLNISSQELLRQFATDLYEERKLETQLTRMMSGHYKVSSDLFRYTRVTNNVYRIIMK